MMPAVPVRTLLLAVVATTLLAACGSSAGPSTATRARVCPKAYAAFKRLQADFNSLGGGGALSVLGADMRAVSADATQFAGYMDQLGAHAGAAQLRRFAGDASAVGSAADKGEYPGVAAALGRLRTDSGALQALSEVHVCSGYL